MTSIMSVEKSSLRPNTSGQMMSLSKSQRMCKFHTNSSMNTGFITPKMMSG